MERSPVSLFFQLPDEPRDILFEMGIQKANKKKNQRKKTILYKKIFASKELRSQDKRRPHSQKMQCWAPSIQAFRAFIVENGGRCAVHEARTIQTKGTNLH